MTQNTATDPPRDPSEGFVLACVVLVTALGLQMGYEMDSAHAFHPHKLALVALAGALLLLCTVTVRLVQQWTYLRAYNATAFVPGIGLLYAWWVWEEVFATTNPLPSMHIDTPWAVAAIPIICHYVLPAVAAASLVTAIAMALRFVPIYLGAAGAAAAVGQTARAAQPKNQPAKDQTSEPGPSDRWPANPPRYKFASMHGNAPLKSELARAANEWREQGRNGILLSGPPGTGKTMAAEALAGELGIGFINVTFGNLASKWINQTTEQVVDVFRAAAQQAPVLLFLDELDAIITNRGAGGDGYSEYQRITTTFLTEAVNLRGTGVLLVAATNYLDRLDDAAIREGRFDFKVEVPLPDAEARRFLILQTLVQNNCQTNESVLDRLTRRWGGFNIPRLQLVTARACEARNADRAAGPQSQAGNPLLNYNDFYQALRRVQGHKAAVPEGAKLLNEIYLEPQPRQRLSDIAATLRDVDQFEKSGGTLPKGILFYGPPGTGKTATAMALARECGWSFIQRRGRDLMAAGEVDKLRQEASDLRPAIVFLDEADDILANREYSAHKSVTNEILTLIDGAGGLLHDVVWIAATNHREAIDPAALRGNRFEQKIQFGPLSNKVMFALVRAWAKANADNLNGKVNDWAFKTSQRLAGLTPADAYSVMALANNMAVAQSLKGASRAITLNHVQRALAEIKGA